MNTQELAKLRRQIINEVIGIEGGYVNDKADSGGATKYGITQATAHQHGISDVATITVEQAYRIYEQDYWHDINADELAQRSPGLAYELFDTAVNMGEARAGGFLQRCLNVLNLNGQFYADILVDHDIGQKTLAALDGFIAHRGQQGLKILVRMLDDLQSAFFIELAERRQKDERFIYGWQSQRVGITYMPKDAQLLPEQPTTALPSISTSVEVKQQEIMMNTTVNAPVYQVPPDGFVEDQSGQTIPYWNNQVQEFEKNPDQGLAAWLKERGELLRQANSKPTWKSKIMWGAGGLVTTGLSVATARFGFDVDPDFLLGIAAVAMTGGGGFIGVARKWFTNKFLG